MTNGRILNGCLVCVERLALAEIPRTAGDEKSLQIARSDRYLFALPVAILGFCSLPLLCFKSVHLRSCWTTTGTRFASFPAYYRVSLVFLILCYSTCFNCTSTRSLRKRFFFDESIDCCSREALKALTEYREEWCVRQK